MSESTIIQENVQNAVNKGRSGELLYRYENRYYTVDRTLSGSFDLKINTV